MNGVDGVGGAQTPTTQMTEETDFDALINDGIMQMGSYMMMFIASDVMEEIMSGG